MAKLALKGGTSLRTKAYPAWPPYDKEEEKELLQVLKSHNWGGYPSPNVKADQFAKAFASAHNAKYGVCAANGTVTLELALKAAGVSAGDEVIVPTYTWVATAAAAVYINAVPILVDVRADNYTIDVAQVEAAITKKTKAVIPVHLGSSIADLDGLKKLCKKHGLVLIEDCAHAHGAKWRKKGVGSHGDFGSFSFQSSKLMTAGEGGLILTNKKDYEMKLQSLVNCGRKEYGYDKFKGNLFGYNYRITEFQAGVLLGQLKKLDKLTKKRMQNAQYLTEALDKIEGIETIKHPKQVTTSAHYQYIFKYNPEGFKGLHRDEFLKAMMAEGFLFDGDFYEPMPERLDNLFSPNVGDWPQLKKRYPKGFHEKLAQKTPVAHKAAYEEAVWVHYPYLMGTKKDTLDIARAIKKIQDNVDELL